MMDGLRKFWIVVIGLFTLLLGVAGCIFKPEIGVGIYATFAGAVVAVCGLFFQANIQEHKNGGG